MTYEELKPILESYVGATLEFPFDEETAVFKVGGKMFALVSVPDVPLRITLKCDPQEAIALREMYPAVTPGYYMNKQHWNTVTLDGSLTNEQVYEMIADSYALVVATLPKAVRTSLASNANAS